MVSGFDTAPAEVGAGLAKGLDESHTAYIGANPLSDDGSVAWLQLLTDGGSTPDSAATALVQVVDSSFEAHKLERLGENQMLGLAVSDAGQLEEVIPFALEAGYDLLLLSGSGSVADTWPELHSRAPDLRVLRDAISILRRLDREEEIDLVYFGGVRTGTDAAKLIGLGAVAMVLGVSAAIAAGGQIDRSDLVFDADLSPEERAGAVANLIQANTGEASMMARCTGKTDLHNVEPEDLRALTLATAEATGLPVAGMRAG